MLGSIKSLYKDLKLQYALARAAKKASGAGASGVKKSLQDFKTIELDEDEEGSGAARQILGERIVQIGTHENLAQVKNSLIIHQACFHHLLGKLEKHTSSVPFLFFTH